MTAFSPMPTIRDGSVFPSGDAASFSGIVLAEALRPSAAADTTLQSLFAATARVATISGEVEAARLTPGMRVLTRDSGYRPVRSVRASGLDALIQVAAGRLGNAFDLCLSPRTGLLITAPCFGELYGAAEVLVPAESLIDGDGVTMLRRPQAVQMITLDLGDSEVIWADGVSVGCGDRTQPAARPVLTGRNAVIAARLAGFGAADRLVA
ncbi:MAG: hypothetical protein RLZZ528_1906 [Pseudomonadota bacterium]